MTKLNKKDPVCVIAELNNCRVIPVSLQLVWKAAKLANKLNVSVEAILVGNQLTMHALSLIYAGADRVFLCDSPELGYYQLETYSKVIMNIIKATNPQILMLGSTFMGRELAPVLAARLKTGLTAHCINLTLNKDNMLEQQVPGYGGIISILCPRSRPQMACVAAGVFPDPELDLSRKGEIKVIYTDDKMTGRVRNIEFIKDSSNSSDSFASANVLVAGGAGACDENGWCKIKELASVLKAPLGCTRPAVDAGWAELNTMIGQSGIMVSPHVYIGVGVSGELQHMVGIQGAKTTIAINKDSEAPIFGQVDYGVVEDCNTFIPIFIEKLKKYKQCV